MSSLRLLLFFFPCFHFTRADLTRQDLYDKLALNQIARSTFDSRVHQRVKPIGYVAGEPIWPRVLERVKSSAELFFDDDNFAYTTHHRGPEHLIRNMDAEENWTRVLRFLNRYST